MTPTQHEWPSKPSEHLTSRITSLPGRTVESILGVPSSSKSVAPIAASGHPSRPGPEFRCGLGISQLATPGKYIQISEPSLPDDDHNSSAFNPSVSASCQPEVATTNRSPGRIIAACPEEAPIPLIAVEPLPPATNSRPGPAFEMEDGVFQTPVSGKYDQLPNVPLPESASVSSGPDRTSLLRHEAPTTSRPQLHASRHETNVVPEQLRSDISIYYQNVGGMNGLVDDYRLAVLDHCYDVLVLTETWLNLRTISSYVFGDEYEIFRCDRNTYNSRKSTGGGVLIAVSSRLKARAIEDDSWNTVEQVWVAIQLGDRQLFLCAVYIPPDRTRDLELIDTHCRSVSAVSGKAAPNDEVFVLGDFNLPGIAWIPTSSGFFCPDHERSTFHIGTIKLLDSYSTATLSQVNGLTNENNRNLDLCFVSGRDTAPFITTAPEPLVKEVHHHPALVIAVEENTVHDFISTPAAVSYDFHRADHRSITEVLSNLDWEHILDHFDVDNAAQTFSHVLAYIIDRHVPKKIVSADSRVPWMSNDLRSLKRTKKAALKRFTKFRTLPLKRYYVQLNHEYKRLSRLCFQRYQRRIQRRLKSHPQSFWKFVNEQRKEVGLPSCMVFDGETVSTQQEICNVFSAKFASVFEDEQLSVDSITSASRNTPLVNQALNGVDVSVETISRAASKLKTSVKPGPDGVPSILLKEHIVSILEPLRRIFQLSLSSGIFPSCWKIADMFPVHKKGSKRDVNNYRGITSLSAVSKLFELVVMDSLNAHCKQYLSVDQHGFTAGRSTTTNLLCLTSYITDSMTAGTQTDVIYTDLSAAFDKLNHEIAIAKLDRLGIGGSLLRWFRSYLTERQLSVVLGAYRSASFCAKSGIPQGSHLGPLIFLLYFNDVHHVIEGPRLSFADDLKIFLRICSIADCRNLQDQIDAFTDWCILNRLVINPAKCSIITFSRKKQPIIFKYNLLGTTLDRVHCVKDLGVLLDSQLTYSHHISYVVDKASRTLGFVFRVAKRFTDIYCLKSLYCSLVRSTLEYCSAVWSPNYNNGVERIESVQRRFLRFALRSLPWRDPLRLPSYESRCQLINLEPLRIRRDVSRALAVADTLQGRIDCEAILQQIDINVQPRPLRHNLMLRLPIRRTNYSLGNAIYGLQRVFNRVASMFDFHLTRNMLRRRFYAFFSDV